MNPQELIEQAEKENKRFKKIGKIISISGKEYDISNLTKLKEMQEACLKEIDDLMNELYLVIDKPKKGVPEVTWNYSVAFNIRILKKLKQRIK